VADPADASAGSSGANVDGVCLAVDAMGGDHGPTEVVAAALAWASEHPGDRLTLVGDADTVHALAGALLPSTSCTRPR
jgi:fatty acid/phospholipid biosynthesis enzyme